MTAAGKKLAVSANNVANAMTDGFEKSRTVNYSLKDGGVAATVEQVDQPGPTVVDPATGEERRLSNVDLAEEMITQIEAKQAFEANIKVLKAEDEALGLVIDTLV